MILNLSGELFPDSWADLFRECGYDRGFYCPADVRNALDSLADGEELELQINSIGGSVDAAAEIYSLLASTQHPTKAVIQSLAASAASYMIQSCDRIEMHLPAQMMIHLASCGISGNKHAMSRGYQMLDAADRSILAVYAKKCAGKTDEATLEHLMENETYLTSSDALAYGLVDAVVGAEDEGGQPMLAASAFSNTVRAMRTLPPVEDLIARKKYQEKAAFEKELAAEMNRYK